MKALVLSDIGKIDYTDYPAPEAQEGEVLLKVKACGICSSDRARIFETGTYDFPTIPGHEIAGEIAGLGRGVNPELLGRKAAVYPLLPCRQCSYCKEGRFSLCEHYSYMGSRCDGGFAEYVAVPVFNIEVLPNDMSYISAAMCEPAAVALHALKRAGMKEGDIVAVVGTGTIGLLAAKIARLRGASKVIVLGRSKERIKFASEHGADHVVNDNWSPEEAVKQLTYGDMANVVLECAGNSESADTAVKIARKGAGVAFVGEPQGQIAFSRDTYWKILRKELNIHGVWNSEFASPESDWREVVALLSSGRLDAESLVTNKFSLSEYREAFSLLKDRERFSVKIMFIMENEETVPEEK